MFRRSADAAGETELLTGGEGAATRSPIHALIEQRADVNAREADGTTPLHWAARAGDLQTVDLLIRAGAEVNAVNRYGMSRRWPLPPGTAPPRSSRRC